MDWDDLGPVALIGAAAALLVALLVWSSNADEKQWKEYSAAHHCRPTGVQRGQIVVTGSGSVGATSDQTVYACDSGEIIIR